MATQTKNRRQRFWRHSDAPSVRQSGRRAVRRLRHGWAPTSRRNPPRPPLRRTRSTPRSPSSWIEIHPDNTILIRTGKSDFGQSTTFTAYRQIVAEELNAPFEAITTVVMGDTDRTPDGSGAFDFLGRGTPNIRKAAAYTYQALLDLASQTAGRSEERAFRQGRRRFGRRQEHVVRRSGEGTAVEAHDPGERQPDQHYGIDGDGNPPMKPVSEYTVIGKSFQEQRHHVQSHRARTMGHRCAAARHAARAHGASEDAWLDARVRR